MGKSDYGVFSRQGHFDVLYFDITSDYVTYYLFHVYLYPFRDQSMNLLHELIFPPAIILTHMYI